jgi:hypothetical protein
MEQGSIPLYIAFGEAGYYLTRNLNAGQRAILAMDIAKLGSTREALLTVAERAVGLDLLRRFKVPS